MVSVNGKTKKGNPITVFSGEGIIISLDGSAGSMTYKSGEIFALNHHAGFITLREQAKKIVSLEYFALFFQKLYRALCVSEGSKTLSLSQIYSEEFDLPLFSMQIRIVDKLMPSLRKLRLLSEKKNRYNNLLNKEISFPYTSFQAKKISISDCVDHMSGNSGLTEEFIYNTLQIKGERYQVLSSSTNDRTMMGEVPICKIGNKKLEVFDKPNGLLVTRNGNAGQTRYLDDGKFTINDHAYILYVKSNCKYKINLKWLGIQYRSAFLEYSSSSDNGTWNMTGFFNNVRIDIPSIAEQQKVVELYEKVEKRVALIESLENHFHELLNKKIMFTT
jgi:restriction endonuclease S subunit